MGPITTPPISSGRTLVRDLLATALMLFFVSGGLAACMAAVTAPPSVPTASTPAEPGGQQQIAAALPDGDPPAPVFVDAKATADAQGVLLAWWSPDGAGEQLRLPHPVAITGYTGRCRQHPGMLQVELAGGGKVWVVAAHVGVSEADVAAQRDQCAGGA